MKEIVNYNKPYFLWFLNIFMMIAYLKLSMFVSSTGQNGQLKYYHLVWSSVIHIFSGKSQVIHVINEYSDK
jgi:hypothetical protein